MESRGHADNREKTRGLMNLKEYLNQKEPVRRPTVTLQEGEFELGIHYPSRGLKGRTQVFVNGGYEELTHEGKRLRNEFILEGDSGVLFATDSDGNARARSVFHIPEGLIKR